MARMIPPMVGASCHSQGERDVFGRLAQDEGAHDWTVLHSLDLAEHRRQLSGEVDFVVIVPGKGVLCLEVKGARTVRRDGGLWYYGGDPNPDSRGPFKQASEGMHSLRTKLAACRPDLSRVLFWTAVVFPYADFREESVEWNAWQMINGDDFATSRLSDLLTSVLDHAWEHVRLKGRTGLVAPTSEQCDEIVRALRPDFEVYESPQSRTRRTHEEVRLFTEEQFVVLDALAEQDRVALVGPAGTGKTLLAIEAARRACEQGRRVLLLCFNRFLAEWLEGQTSPLGPGCTCRSLSSYMLQLSGVIPKGFGPRFWDEDLPRLASHVLKERASRGTTDHLYDELVIDEAQDVLRRPGFVEVLDRSLVDGLRHGKWRIFGDFEGQAIFGGRGEALKNLLEKTVDPPTTLTLKVNCRNTPRVAALASGVGGFNYSRVRRPDDEIDPKVLVYEREQGQPALLARVLSDLLAEHYSPENIVVLSPRAANACAPRLTGSPWRKRLAPLDEIGPTQVGYATIQSFKGREAAAVVVTDVDGAVDVSLLYIAITRAVERLVVLANRLGEERMRKARSEPTSQ